RFLLRFQKTAYRVAVYFPWVVKRDPDHWVDLDYYVQCIQTNQQIDVQQLLSDMQDVVGSLSSGWWGCFCRYWFYGRCWVPIRYHLWRRWVWRDAPEGGSWRKSASLWRAASVQSRRFGPRDGARHGRPPQQRDEAGMNCRSRREA